MSHATTGTPASPPQVTRRSFFENAFLGVTVVVGLLAVAVFALPFLLFLLGPTRKGDVRWVKLGPVGMFPKDETRLATFDNPLRTEWDGMTANTGVYVRSMGKDGNGKDDFMVFSVNCAHLGCPVTWFPQSRLFMCPCHGGVYYENGDRASGPPPRGLYQCVWRITDGQLEIQAPHYPTLQHTLDGKA